MSARRLPSWWTWLINFSSIKSSSSSNQSSTPWNWQKYSLRMPSQAKLFTVISHKRKESRSMKDSSNSSTAFSSPRRSSGEALTLRRSTLSSTTICLRVLTHTSTELDVRADSERKVSPSPSLALMKTKLSLTKSKRGSKSRSKSCLLRSTQPPTWTTEKAHRPWANQPQITRKVN